MTQYHFTGFIDPKNIYCDSKSDLTCVFRYISLYGPKVGYFRIPRGNFASSSNEVKSHLTSLPSVHSLFYLVNQHASDCGPLTTRPPVFKQWITAVYHLCCLYGCFHGNRQHIAMHKNTFQKRNKAASD